MYNRYMEDAERKRLWAEANREKVREQQRRYYEANREKVKQRSRDWQEANREESREQKRRWDRANPDMRAEGLRRRNKEARDQVLAHYGMACACCGATDRLTIDHVNAGGRAHRIELFGHPGGSGAFYHWLIANNFPPGYQVLCRRCNSSKATGTTCRLDHALTSADRQGPAE
jgi:hypothetical protein